MKTRLYRTLLVAAALALLSSAAPGTGMEVDGYAALVNSRVITVGDVLALIRPVRMQLEKTYVGEELEAKTEESYQAGLQALIERSLILEEFTAQGGTIPDRFIDDQISEIISDNFDNDRAAFLKALTEDRLTLDDWREETRNRLQVTILRRKEVTDKVVIPPRVAREVYEASLDKYRTPAQIKLRMIALHKGETAEDQAAKLREAEQIRERLLAGEDFGEVAKSSSEGIKAAKGGDMGWVEPGSLRAELAKASEMLEPGRISEVIPTDEEFYILKVEARKNAAVTPFEEAQRAIEKELRKAEEDRLYKTWMQRLKDKYYVKIFSPAEE